MTQLTRQRAGELLNTMRDRKIVVFGDVMLDEFVWGDVTRISPEAPVPVVNVQRESIHLGGAANVLANLISLGARASVTGIVGIDAAGERIRATLRATGAGDDLLIADANRPTTTKTRIIAHNQMVVRADRERRSPVDDTIAARVVSLISEALTDADALVISDYDKGVVTPGILAKVLPLAYERVPVLIDPKLRNFDSYRPATLVTPNHHEALRLANIEEDTDDGLTRAAQLIRARITCDAVLITRGDRGMMLLEGKQEPVFVETAAREVYDVTGAGDTVIATLAAALAAGASTIEAAVLANHAAGIVVGKLGTETASVDEILASIS
ncbi:MAG TPA: D-glycero-beta-D-manno-heptose-7-phosphate kinase [Pyrinomonadaceae bacterium]